MGLKEQSFEWWDGGKDFNSAGHKVKLVHQHRDDDRRRDPTRVVESIYFEHAQIWMKVFC